MSFVSGDTGSTLEVTCKDDDTDLVIPLTGATVKLKWIDNSDTLQSRAMTIVDAVGGIVEYQFLAADLTGTQMRFEVEITDSAGKILHSLELIRENCRTALA